MMTLKEVLDTAKLHLKDLSSLENPDFRLEQAEYKKNEKIWDIVVSFLVENTNKRMSGLFITSEFQFHRIYKRVKIDDNKEFLGIFIYNNKE